MSKTAITHTRTWQCADKHCDCCQMDAREPEGPRILCSGCARYLCEPCARRCRHERSEHHHITTPSNVSRHEVDTLVEQDRQDASGPTGPEPVTPKAQHPEGCQITWTHPAHDSCPGATGPLDPSGAVERVVRAADEVLAELAASGGRFTDKQSALFDLVRAAPAAGPGPEPAA